MSASPFFFCTTLPLSMANALNDAPESMSGATAIAAQLKVLRDSLDVQVPYTGGIHPVKAEDLVVYYDVQGEKYARYAPSLYGLLL
jgi:hypothetical protein